MSDTTTVSYTGGPATDAGELLAEVRGGALWLTLNRPQSANALKPDQRNELIAIFERASADPAVRVIVLAAEGKHFCSGADLTGTGDGGPPPVGHIAWTLRTGSQRLTSAVLDCEKPVVAEVHGAAAGIGAHLAMACDFVVAADDARLIEIFARRGLVADGGGAYLLPRLVGLNKAKEIMFLADDLPAPVAVDLGIFTKAVPAADLRKATEDLVERLENAPTRTLGLTKWLLNRSLDSSRDQAFHDEAIAQEQNMTTEDAAEGVRAFLERRPTAFSGR